MAADRSPDAPLWIVLVAFAGAVVALAGGYWDDAWHTDRGRDDFFIAPHIAIYGGISAAGGALSAWALLRARTGGVRAVVEHRPLALALLSVAVTLASGPIDNAWHVAFGKDAVFWSPPHMLGIAGTLALGAAILAELGRRGHRTARAMTAIAGALVLASAAFAVVEYDTDVPQFDAVWYLPVLALGAAIALALVRLASDRPYAATEAASVHLLFVLAAALFLVAAEFPTPGLPLIVPAALVLDIAANRRSPLVVQAAAFTAALYATYVPARNWLGDGVEFDAADVVVGAPIAFLATWATLAVARGGLPTRRALGATAALGALAVAAAGPSVAGAHDPGQGKAAGTLSLSVAAEGQTITIEGIAAGTNCRGLSARSLAVRRGGETLRAPLVLSGWRFRGTIEVPDRGRWFTYAELRRDGRNIESWLPVHAGDGRDEVRDTSRYAYEPDDSSATPVQLVAGIVLYAGMLGLFVATFALVRGTRGAVARR